MSLSLVRYCAHPQAAKNQGVRGKLTNAMYPELIYCADGNAEFARIAVEAGFKYGAQLPPRGLPFSPYFADQNWKDPNRERYISELAKHRPFMASVLDWERPEQLSEVLNWAEEAAQFVETVMIIPKVIGQIDKIPASVGGKAIRLGYSVPTRFGGTQVPIWEFGKREVHLLGGSPKAQFTLFHYLNVVSVDGNMHQLMATKYCAFFSLVRIPGVRNHPWPTLIEADGKTWGDGSNMANAPYEAFRRSCAAIKTMWHTSTLPSNKAMQPTARPRLLPE